MRLPTILAATSSEIMKARWFGSLATNYVNRAHVLLFQAEILCAAALLEVGRTSLAESAWRAMSERP